MMMIVKGEYWLLNYGLNSILIAAERLEFTISQINCELISEAYWNITKPFKAPIILEERNILLVSELKNNDVILQSEYEYFKNGFIESKNSIEIYRNKLMKKIIANNLKVTKHPSVHKGRWVFAYTPFFLRKSEGLTPVHLLNCLLKWERFL